MSPYVDRSRCSTCGHGFGVHSRVEQALVFEYGEIEFFERLRDARERCTGYPDQMGKDWPLGPRRCGCREFVRPE